MRGKETPCEQFRRYLNADEATFSLAEVQQWLADHLKGCPACNVFLDEEDKKFAEFLKPLTDHYRHLPPEERDAAITRDQRFAQLLLRFGWFDRSRRKNLLDHIRRGDLQ